MYLRLRFKQKIFLPSCEFNENFKRTLISSLLSSVEGKKIGNFGCIILVTEISQHFKKAKLIIGSSSALFSINYVGITLKFFKGEVIDSIISIITEFGFFTEVGNMKIFVPKKFIPPDFIFDQEMSRFYIPRGLGKEISKDKAIRVRIIGTKQEINFEQSLGSIKEANLGLL
mmetsp:Transcript_38990/g.60749  ORF Transcript_38990/g.60749 Transcript_38990/m.60749 type:complete len:172 (+) Transcript_38990:595-1110(+)